MFATTLLGLPLTGEQLLRAAARDFETFFDVDLDLKIEFGGRNIAATVGVGDNSRLRFRRDIASWAVETADDLHLLLIIFGHEIAHLVHRHNEIQREPHDDRSLEDWADFYGAKVMMALVTYGPEIAILYRSLFGRSAFAAPLRSVSRALGRLMPIYETRSAKYSNRLSRVGLNVIGVTSFLNTNAPGFRFEHIPQTYCCLLSGDVLQHAFIAEGHDYLGDDTTGRSLELHRRLQGGGNAITAGMLEPMSWSIGTGFNTTDEEQQRVLNEWRVAAANLGIRA